VRRAPAGASERRLAARCGPESSPVDDVGDVLGGAGAQAPVGEPLAQLGDAQPALGGQCRRLAPALQVRVLAVRVKPRAEDRHRAGRQRTRTTSASEQHHSSTEKRQTINTENI